MSPVALRRQIGQLLIAGFDGEQIPVELQVAGARVRARRRHPLRAQHRRARTGRRALLTKRRGSSPTLPAWVSVDQEGGRVARLKAPFTEWPPMATLGRSGDVALAERFARALAAELRAVGITLDYAPVLDVHTNPEEPGDRRSRAGREGRGRRAPRQRDRPRRCRPKASRPAASTFPGTATRAPTRISSCRSSSIRPSGCARSSSCRSRPRSRPASPPS